MAPYDPPCTHYAHIRVDMYDDEVVWAFIGTNGWRLYDLTEKLKLSYLWYNSKLGVIEIWGSENSLRRNPGEKISKKLRIFSQGVSLVMRRVRNKDAESEAYNKAFPPLVHNSC